MNTTLKYVGSAVLGFVSAAGIFYGIYANMTLPRGKLGAEISVNSITLPPSRRDTTRFGPNDTPTSDSVASRTGLELNGGLQRLGFYPSPKGYLEAHIENEGTREIKQVLLRVPDAVVGCVRRGAADFVCQANNGLYTVGDLQPLDEANVKIWLSSTPALTNLDLIRLTHTEGVGRITFTTVETPQTRSARNRETAFTYMMLFLVTVQLIIVLMVNKRLDRTLGKMKKTSGPE